jgi:putative hydrolase of the HAD superfamily
MKTILFDMYGVILKESKGNFIPYTYNLFPASEHEKLTRLFKIDKLFTKAGNGELSSDEFLSGLGFSDTVFHMHDYIENYLTIDTGFYIFADAFRDQYHYALLSNDVSDWSKYITEYYGLDKYFMHKIISADVHCRKPERRIFEIALEDLSAAASDCIFIVNSVENLKTAEKIGMNTILFNRDNESYDGLSVYSFEELFQVFKTWALPV